MSRPQPGEEPALADQLVWRAARRRKRLDADRPLYALPPRGDPRLWTFATRAEVEDLIGRELGAQSAGRPIMVLGVDVIVLEDLLPSDQGPPGRAGR
jgi:hypothetical protein